MPTGATLAPQGAAILPTGATLAPQGAVILPTGATLAPQGAVVGKSGNTGMLSGPATLARLLRPRIDRGREGSRLPSLRTVRAVFPHTALQSAVSTSGRAGERFPKGESTVPRYRDSPQIQCRVTAFGWLGSFQLLGALTRGIPRALDCIRPCISTFLPPFPMDGFAARPLPSSPVAV